jgi:hypothetical protein
MYLPSGEHSVKSILKRVKPTDMRRRVGLVSSLALLAGCAGPGQIDETELVTEAQAITRQFVSTLLPTLQTALQNGGPAAAIEVCSVQAPAIASQLAAQTGWDVSRVSLKPRNTSSATPDSWERRQLQDFESRQRSGEAGATINHGELRGREYRYMQAQPAMPLCLTCHGSDLSPDVQNALGRLYPDDLAIGYSEGDIRGAISLKKPL